MGIKHFFTWFRRRFDNNISRLKKGDTLKDTVIDNLLIDMNGIFHNSAQKIYEYGNYKPLKSLLNQNRTKPSGIQKNISLFRDICCSVDNVLQIVKPRKRLVLCVDGPAPLSKQNQQRLRRFVSAMNRDEHTWDSNQITPGTKFMDYLSKYIDWYIRKKVSEDLYWKNLEVTFSNEKSAGEGEQKCINLIRLLDARDESYCIHGMDADLIMLSLGTHIPNFYILREDQYGEYHFYFIDVGNTRSELAQIMKWEESDIEYDEKCAINDFIFMCFSVGNDFLPHIPGVEIIEGGIDFMIDAYKNVCKTYGHITRYRNNGDVQFQKKSLCVFLQTISQYEKIILENKLSHKDQYFPDELLDNNSKLTENGTYCVNIEKYREDYYQSNFSEVKNMETVCHEYLEGMQWVLSYYTKGVPNWKWRYTHHYAPFSYTLATHINTFTFPVYNRTYSTVPFVQLLSVLPPKSSDLLPSPLNTLLTSTISPLSKYCPEKFHIDLSGKRREWEGIVILPMIDYNVVEKAYFSLIHRVESKERKRNILGKSFIYTFSPENNFIFKSFYGDINCRVLIKSIEL